MTSARTSGREPRPAGRRGRPAPYAWRPLSCFGFFGLFWGTWGALLPAVREQTGATEAQLGLALLVLAAAALPAMLSGGWVIDRLGDRALGPMAAAFGVAVALPGAAHSVVALGASLAVVGAASGALDVTMNSAVAEEEERGGRRLMHGAHALFSVGVVLGSVSTGLARASGAGPPHLLAAAGGLTMILGLWLHLTRRRSEQGSVVSRPPRGAGRLVLLSVPLLALGGLCALAYLVENALQSWSALHLEDSLRVGPAVGGLGPAFFAGAAAAGRLSAQRIAALTSDRILLVAAAGFGAGGTAVTAFAPSVPVALGGVLVAGAGISVAAPTLFSLAGRMAGPGERGRAMASVTTVAYLGFLVGPPLVGALAGAFDLRLALGAVAAVSVLLAALSLAVPRR